MRKLLRLSFVLFFFVAYRADGQDKGVYSPDRNYFFEKCATIRNFGQDVKNGPVREGRPVKVTPEMKATISRFFDYWQVKGDWDKRKLAYILAIAFRETRGTFQPVRETLAQKAPNYALPAPNGKRYYGRGYVQLTHPGNYLKAGEKLGMGAELYDDPDKALDPEIALRILINGMVDGGYFGSKTLSGYFTEQKHDWFNARDIVNPGSPHKATTESIARGINACLK